MFFEVVSKYADAGLALPVRATKHAAGYDLAAAEDIIIPPYVELYNNLWGARHSDHEPISLTEMAQLTKTTKAKPTLVSTGMKCQLTSDKYLELSVRSSSPLKYWLVLANGVGIIDADYYNNPDNEGEIFLQLINLSPYPILIQKGEKIGQGIIKSYYTTADDATTVERTGGFGSTTING